MPDVDAVLTTRELAKLIRMAGIDMDALDADLPDSPFGARSSAGKLFGATGGVMEAALRTAYHMLTGENLTEPIIDEVRGLEGRKETKVTIGDTTYGFAVVSGLSNARELLDEIKGGRDDIHFIEVMTCPGGCINGGGQPLGTDVNAVKKRMQRLYSIDRDDKIHFSHENPDIERIYKEYLEKPLGKKSHELLHTKYQTREEVTL
jgi:iron only hydrogenase large subunit-like protein